MSTLPDVEPSPLAIVVGVTGHRDLRVEDEPRLETAFQSVLIELGQRYPHSSVLLLSSLAEGADRLAAKVALDLGLRLVVPLPLPRELYEEDFDTPESRQQFATLLQRATAIIPLPLLDGVTEAEVRNPGCARDREYAKVGAYIARHSHVFVAFWDGSAESEENVGGTAHTVAFRLRGIPAPYAWSERPLAIRAAEGPALQIHTPRRGKASPNAVAGATTLHVPHDGLHDSVHQLCARMNLFNEDAARLADALRARAGVSQAQLLNSDAASAPPLLAALPAICQHIADQYATADGLALHFGSRTRATWKHVFLGVGAAALIFHVHAAFYGVHGEAPASFGEGLMTLPWFLIAFLALSAFTATWIYRRAERREYQTKYQDYRALAEALRIQFYWRIAGVPDPVVENYLRKQRSELEWIRSALKSCDVMTAPAESAATRAWKPLPEQLHFVTLWIQDQRKYFASKARSEKRTEHRDETIAMWLLKASGVLSVALMILLSLPFLTTIAPVEHLLPLVPSHLLYEFLMVIIPFMAVAAGLLEGYGRQLARAEHIRQYTRMSELFAAGERELEGLLKDGRHEEAAALVRVLGIEALDENGDWLTLHRERPLEIPAG